MFVGEQNLIFNKEMSDLIGGKKKKTEVAEFPAWCYKTTQRVTWELFLPPADSFYLLTEESR